MIFQKVFGNCSTTGILVSILLVVTIVWTMVSITFGTNFLHRINETAADTSLRGITLLSKVRSNLQPPPPVNTLVLNSSPDSDGWKKPKLKCPEDLLNRVGGAGDGGKWTCGLKSLADCSANCVVYSFGVSRNSWFEAEVLQTTSCRVYAYDPTVTKIGAPLSPSNRRVTFRPWGISNRTNGTDKTLKDVMQENNHTWIDILKMDIEGGEYSVFDNIFQDFKVKGIPFGQLMIELHASKNSKLDMMLIMRLEEFGYKMFSMEPNVHYVSYGYTEYSFMNTKESSFRKFVPINGTN